jgi:hypothetical protein
MDPSVEMSKHIFAGREKTYDMLLAWHPEDRQTAGHSMEHPFLNG